MDQIAKERDRLLARTARVFGLGFTLVALVCVVLPGAATSGALVIAVPALIVLGVAQQRLGASGSWAWVALAFLAGLLAIAALGLGADRAPTAAALDAVLLLAAGSLSSLGVVLSRGPLRRALLVLCWIITAALTAAVTTIETRATIVSLATVTLGWALGGLLGIWIVASIPQTARRIASIGRAHRAERQASELEAQRRQGARLLHDTVLATLTLLAHSGVGVNAQALAAQAGDDARLLRQLRLGASPTPSSYGGADVKVPVDETPLGTTLESVKQRFGRMGLEVSWHGTGQVLLPSHVLDAFLLALAECLENVRRHSGVTEAHVTIVDDEKTVRAMVTDAGVGFNIDDVDAARLGFKESVVARLRDVGGSARLFSAPGSGTTVVLEVPR